MTPELLLASLLQIMDLKLRKGIGPKSSSKLLVITTIRGFTEYLPKPDAELRTLQAHYTSGGGGMSIID